MPWCHSHFNCCDSIFIDIFCDLNLANLYKKCYACIIYCYLLNRIVKAFINRILGMMIKQ